MSEENNEKKKKDFVVEIDTKETERLATEKEKLRAENEELREKLSLIAEKEIEKKMREYHIDMSRKAEFMANPDALKDYAPRQTPSGSAPLNDAQMHGGNESYDLYRRRFPDEKSMVDEILSLMHSSDPQKAEVARSYYEALLTQWVRTKKHRQGLDEFYDPNQPSELPPMTKTPEGFVTPQDKSEGDIGKIMKKWRMERKRKAEEGAQT